MKTTPVRVSVHALDRARQLADDSGLSIAEVVSAAVHAFCDRNNVPTKEGQA